MMTYVAGVGGGSICSFSDEARNGSVGLSCDSAWNTADGCSDVSDIKAMACKSEVLATSLISGIGTSFEDYGNCLYLIASGVIVGAVQVFGLLVVGIAGLPQHGEILACLRQLVTDLASDTVLSPLTKGGLRINVELEVDLVAGDLSVDEIHLIILEILDQVLGALWVEPHFGHRLEVDDGWRQVVNDWGVRSDELNLAIARSGTHEGLHFIQTICRRNGEVEGHREVGVQESSWHHEQIIDCGQSVLKIASLGVGPKGIILGEHWSNDGCVQLPAKQQDSV
jgi:hypothetical protein